MAHSIETIDELQHQGYDQIFELAGNKLMSTQTGFYFYPRELNVDQIIKVEQLGNCYALSCPSGEHKGLFMIYVDAVDRL